MNFLAHAYLSGTDPDILTGNFIGDFVKGNQLLTYPKEIQDGVLLHREIDSFTDRHPIVKSSKSRLRKYKHYAGVIVDMYYDHFLAANWQTWHDQNLNEYSNAVYSILSSAEGLPQRFRHMMTYMERQNWLLSYAQIDGLHQALTGMSRRTKFPSRMEHASEDLREDYQLFKKEFDEFFPLIINFVQTFTFVKFPSQ